MRPLRKIPPYIVLEKPIGQTPLEAIERWQHTHPQFASVPATYAGRLDPMASGKLLVLLGNECKKRELYTKLDKEYEVEVVLDLSTDTGDALGLPDYQNQETLLPNLNSMSIQAVLKRLQGSHAVPYPAFSSRTVNGKPLFLYALEGTLDTISIPEHVETVYRIKLLEARAYARAELQERIDTTLVTVPRSDDPEKELGADFRQDVIRAGWRALFSAIPERTFVVMRLKVSCASGTYMRTLAERIGRELDTTGFALSIRRTRIGKYTKFRSVYFWSKQYR